MSNQIERVPDGYYLHAFDDCGVPGHQPHVDMDGCYNFTFSTHDADADLKSRSAVFSYKEIRINYDKLDPNLSYLLAMTYASDQTYKRVQSLEADGVELHGPIALPNGKAIRTVVKVPASVTQDGKMALKIKIHGEVNATASIVELWASTPLSGPSVRFGPVAALPDGLGGRITDLTYDGLAGVVVRLARPGDSKALATTTTEPNGSFTFQGNALRALAPQEDIEIMATRDGQEIRMTVPAADRSFEPVRFRPIPAKVTGLKNNTLSLDGPWRIDPSPDVETRRQPLDAPKWGNFHAPGQWAQQGYDVPRDKPVALAREFTIPAEWAGYRIFLRFDAIHGGTHYWLNGKPLGESENLFTPVEWEITDAARPGQTNRLDLEMVVATTSERLSTSSDYAGHNLGGIDRAVRLFALPKVHLSNLRVMAGLDKAYQNGELHLELGLDNPAATPHTGLTASILLYEADNKTPVEHSATTLALDALKPGPNSVSINSVVPNPLKWNAEQPNLYKLVLELRRSGKLIERIEKQIGFRKVEVKNSQLYVNGARVKLAGVCRHEIDPLTGRADTMRHAEQDVKLFKAANLNLVRTSHYPCAQEFLDAADRYGLYVECEAPFCWVAPATDLSDLKAILTPTSAMIDYNHAHPSVILWSLANESHWSELFKHSNDLCKQLDPTRPTTINHVFSREGDVTCDISNRHYQPMPYDEVLKNDPRPFLHGECFFEVYHERTDVAINPGLRGLWANGSADPTSDWGKACIEDFTAPGGLRPGIHPGAWSHIVESKRCIGSEIWSGVDDISFLPGAKRVSSENANAYWGLVDGWRRPKPEWWLSKLLFSPVWFPVRHVNYQPGQSSIRIPVENRYAFTDLRSLSFSWEIDGAKGAVKTSVPPLSKGELEIPIANRTPEGHKLILRVTSAAGELINTLAISLGKQKLAPLPRPSAGAPKWQDDGKTITIQGKGFSLALDRASGDFDPANPNHTAPILSFPALHVTRYDFGDLNPGAPPYAEFPDASTRVVDSVTATESADGLQIAIQDRYDRFAGSVRWTIDNEGVGRVNYDYTFAGEDLGTREIGVKTLLRPACDQLKWRRWSEWEIFPEDSILRTEGAAKARRDAKWPDAPANVKPSWPWKLDQTELGTNDFRSIKFNIYKASLQAPDGSGLQMDANADAHLRACLAKDGVKMHLLTQCPLAQVILRNGDRIKGEFVVELLRRKSAK